MSIHGPRYSKGQFVLRLCRPHIRSPAVLFLRPSRHANFPVPIRLWTFRGMTTTANSHGTHYAVIARDRTQTFQNGIYGKHGRDSPKASPASDLLVTAGAPGPQRRMHNNSLSFARSWRTARVEAALAAAGFLRKSDRERGRAPDVVNGDFLWRVMVGERLS